MHLDGWEFLMLTSLSTTIRLCYESAEYCARQADKQSDPGLRRDFLENERGWLKLAESYALLERIGRFIDWLPPDPSLPH